MHNTTTRARRGRRAAIVGIGSVVALGAGASGAVAQDDPAVTVLPPTVTHTATLNVLNFYAWKATKTASTPVLADKGDAFRVDYRVEASRRLVRSLVTVTGTISVSNPNTPGALTLTEVAINANGIPCQVQGHSPGEFLFNDQSPRSYPYTCTLPSLPTEINTTAGVSVAELPVGVGSTAQVVMTDGMTSDYAAQVRVEDTVTGEATRVLADRLAQSKVFRYSRYFGIPDKGCVTRTNTARLMPVDYMPSLVDPGSTARPMGPMEPPPGYVSSASVSLCAPPPPPKDPPAPPKDTPTPPKDTATTPNTPTPPKDVPVPPKGTASTPVAPLTAAPVVAAPATPAKGAAPTGTTASAPAAPAQARDQLRVVVQRSARQVRRGATARWVARITNTGPAVVRDVRVSALVPGAARLAGAPATLTQIASGQMVELPLTAVARGARVACVTVTAATPAATSSQRSCVRIVGRATR